MNDRTNQLGSDNSIAQDLVFENLGIENDNLGNEDNDDHEFGDGDPLGGEGDDDLGLGDDNDPFIEQDPELDQQNQQRQQQQPQQRVSHTPRPMPKKAEVKADAKGNLVDANGKIVARAGSEARIYQGRQKAQRDLSVAQAEVQDYSTRLTKAIEIGRGLHAEVQAFKARETQLKQFGFSSEDQIAAMELFSRIRKEPGKTIQALLTKAAANGITVGTSGNPSGIDPKGIADAIKEILGAELKPLKDQQAQLAAERTQQEEQQRALAAVQTEVNTFFNRNPDAQQYLPVFKRIMADPKYKDWSLGEIYARILRANPSQSSNNGRQRQSSRTPWRGSPPNGRSNPPMKGSPMASPDESYDSILKDVMKSAGY